MKGGWILLHKRIAGHWLCDDKPFDMFHAWCDLLMEANYEDAMRPYMGRIVEQKRGQVLYTIKGLCDRWGWSYRKVRRFLDALERDGMVTLERQGSGNYHGNLLTIEKYDFYQSNGNYGGNYQGNYGAIMKQTTKEEIKEENKETRARGSVSDDTPAAALEEGEAEAMPDWFKEQFEKTFGRI